MRRSLQLLPSIHTRVYAPQLGSLTRQSSSWNTGPSPPRLPKEDQEIFERLQRQSTGAFSTPRPLPSADEAASTNAASASAETSQPPFRRQPPQINQSPQSSTSADTAVKQPADASPDARAVREATASAAAGVGANTKAQADVNAKIDDREPLHPNVRRGAPPEFEGDINPRTGEVGGPKNEPLRWGVQGDWSYNGRVTDF